MSQVLIALSLAAPTIPVQGDLADAGGAPLQGVHELQLSIHAAASGGSALWAESDDVLFLDGAFSALIGDASGFDPAIFATSGDLWIQVAVDGGAPSNRIPVGWSPRAGWAANAGQLDGHPISDFVQVTDPMPWSRLADVPDLQLATDALDWSRLTGVPDLQLATDNLAWSRLTDVPSLQLSSDSIAWGRITGVPELGRTYAAGTGLSLSGTTFSANQATIEGWAQGVAYDTPAELTGALDNTYARRDSTNPIRVGSTGTTSTCASGQYGTIRWTGANFEGCTPQGWRTLTGGGGSSGTGGTIGGDGSAANPGRTCRTIKYANPAATSGLYWIDPELDGAAIQVQCDMTRAGGGWTFGLKTWYQAGIAGQQGAQGVVADALTLKGNTYKLSDDDIRDIIGPSNNFDVFVDQAGYNSQYSGGNYEYVTLTNYTGWFSYGGPMLESTTPTAFTSYRASDGAVAWTGRLACGGSGGTHAVNYGVNCYNVISNNPAGGAGCTINMGVNNSGWHTFYMGASDTDTYTYICNGAQHSSGNAMNHRFWFRERYDPVLNSVGTQANPGRTCKAIKAAVPSAGDGVYWIDPEQDGSPIQAQCDMTRAGGGWTMGLKVWYQGGVYAATGAVGTVADAVTLKGANYKLSDNDINDVIGAARNFDVLADQAGYNSTYSGGNYEYTVLSNYTGTFNFGVSMAESTTTTSLTSYRASDNAALWTGRLACGNGSINSGARGINCLDVVSGTNPAGGSGCAAAMGSTSPSWHHWFMSNHDTDTYLYLCNGAQHTSGHSMSHRFWFRER
jgi:hypothetical protein